MKNIFSLLAIILLFSITAPTMACGIFDSCCEGIFCQQDSDEGAE